MVDQGDSVKYEITSPDGRKYEVTAPDGASEAEVLAYAQRAFTKVTPDKPLDPTEGMGTGEKILAGVGKGFNDIGLAARQALGLADTKDVAEARRLEAPLMNTKSGVVGNVIGSVAAGAVPAMMLPSVGGAAAVGGALGAFQPVGDGESRFANTAIGGALGGASQWGLGKLAGMAGNKLATAEAEAASRASQNSVRDATLKASQEAGYVVPPSQAGGGGVARVLEGISGKYKTNQAAAIKNQNVTDQLARKAVGLAPDEPITREAMQAVRDRAFQSGYEPLTKAGAIETDRVFQRALDDIVTDYQGAARSFPDAVPNEVMKRIDSLRTGALDVGDGLKMTRILRDEANQAYVSGNPAIGKATKKAANAIEDQIERALEGAGESGKEMLGKFREARTLMAKAHSVEKAIVEAGGHVNAKVLGAALQRGKPLTDELRTVGAFANNFKGVAGVPESGWANPITALDAFGVAGMGAMGAGPMSIALPAARVAARSAILGPMQKGLKPNYDPGLLTALPPKVLEELKRLGAGGLMGGYAGQ